MGSIFGIYNIGGRPASEVELRLMEHTLNYWNADARNLWFAEHVGLGCLTLYNTAESLTSNSSFNDSDQCIVADVRLDNREELFQLLHIDPFEGKSISDGVLIAKLYDKYNDRCVQHLIGDFAFALWDKRGQRLFCARDHMGVKPFFYYKDNGVFAFATEKKALLCLTGIDKTIDNEYLCNQLFEPCIQAADTTLYKHIKRLPPAHTLTIDKFSDKLTLQRYWTMDPYKEIKLRKPDDCYEGLRFHFERAVKCRLLSVYDIGTELSGGLDSSSITGAASVFLKAEGRKLCTFSNVSGENDGPIPANDERVFAESVIKYNGIEDFEFVTTNIWDKVLDEVDFGLGVHDGLERPNMLWLAPIKNAAMQKGVRTLLSGFPGDEMVTYRGQFYFLDYLDQKKYISYLFAKSQRPFNRLKPFVPTNVEFLIHKIKNVGRLYRGDVKDFLESLDIPAGLRFSKGDVAWESDLYRERFKSYRHFQKYRLLRPQVSQRMEAETRLGLYFKTESRYPMADIRLTEYYLSMPNDLKYSGSVTRSAFRQAVKRYLPGEIFEREGKSGNVAPFKTAAGYKAGWRDAVRILLERYNNRSDLYKKVVLVKNKHLSQEPLEILRWRELNDPQ